MQLQTDSNPAFNTVTAYGKDYIEINAISYHHAVYFGPEGEIHAWPVQSVDDIDLARMREIAGLQDRPIDPMEFLDATDAPQKPANAPEVVLIGTGAKHRFLAPHLVQNLLKLGIGVETMSTQAAARTYNILMSEGRRVIAALLPLEQHP